MQLMRIRLYPLPQLFRYLSAVTACWLSPHVCVADSSTYRPVRDQLALELAVVAAHEGALENTPDTALVWQVVESRATTTQGRLNFLRAHSPRALGRKACNVGNCIWSQELLRAPDEPPASLSAAWWTSQRAGIWERLRRYASELVYGIELWRPCPAAPYSWGYAGDLESAWTERRLVPLGCEGTMNEGFTIAPRSLTAMWIKHGAIEARRARYRSQR